MITPGQIGQEPSGRRKRRWPAVMFSVAGGFILLAIGASIGGAAAGNSHPEPVTVTATATVPGPATTETVTESPPAAAAGTRIGKWSGTGNQVTPAFTVPGDGNYIVTWTYYGNTDTSFGQAQPDNFSISNTGDGIGTGLPNDIASSGSGSTEVTGGSGTDRFNVQANGSGHWTITVKSAD